MYCKYSIYVRVVGIFQATNLLKSQKYLTYVAFLWGSLNQAVYESDQGNQVWSNSYKTFYRSNLKNQ
jgi:hypothetical protein